MSNNPPKTTVTREADVTHVRGCGIPGLEIDNKPDGWSKPRFIGVYDDRFIAAKEILMSRTTIPAGNGRATTNINGQTAPEGDLDIDVVTEEFKGNPILSFIDRGRATHSRRHHHPADSPPNAPKCGRRVTRTFGPRGQIWKLCRACIPGDRPGTRAQS